MIELLAPAFLACLVLAGIHVYLGLHVLARGVIFVDLALAQVAALGLTVAFLAGHPIASPAAYSYALAFAVGGGVFFALTRTRRPAMPQEAIIGVVYAVSAAVAVIAVDRAPQGGEHIKQLLVGNILTVSAAEVGRLAALYAVVGALHWVIRRPLLDVSLAPGAAVARGRAVRAWDAVFYASFAVVVTSSVRVAGVLLVFALLVVPAAIGALLARSVGARLLIGWSVGALVSGAGLAASYRWDLPTGATLVAGFGAALAAVALALGGVALGRDVRARGAAALRPLAGVLGLTVALAGALLAVFPRMDHPWLDVIEEVAPAVRDLLLTRGERAAVADSRAAIARAETDLSQARRRLEDAQWGTRPLDPERQARLRQYLAGRAEITAGDRLVVRTLRAKARERQRWIVGVPLLLVGGTTAWMLLRRST
ncbi:MAG: metal ABC transporter permease [Candidatus Rokuibacteriota bacterium]